MVQAILKIGRAIMEKDKKVNREALTKIINDLNDKRKKGILKCKSQLKR